MKSRMYAQGSRSRSARKRIFLAIKVLLIIAPLPFGCVGGAWRPLFFAALALIAIQAWQEAEKKARTPERTPAKKDAARELLYGRHVPGKVKSRGAMAWAARLWTAFALFCLFQLLPLPAAVVRLFSPATVDVVTRLRGQTPGWLTLSLVPRETLVFLLEFLVLAGFGLALVRLRPGWREMNSLARVLGLSAALQVSIGLVRVLTGSGNFFIFFAPWQPAEGELTGTLVNANHFAFFLEMAVPLLLAMLAVEISGRGGRMLNRVLDTLEKKPRALALLLALILAFTGVVLSNSRAGLTALIVGVVTAGMLMVRGSQGGVRRLLPFVAAGLAFLLVLAAGAGTWRHFKRLEQKTPERIGRVLRWRNVARLARDFPLAGTGMGTFRWAYFLHDSEANQWVTHAHNDVLETATDGGVMGGVLFMGGMVLFFVAVVSAWRKRNQLSVRLLAAGGIASMAAAFFHSLFDFSLRIPVNAMALVLIMALTWRVVHYRRIPARPQPLRDGGTW